MLPFGQHLRALLGRALGPDDPVAVFSVHLDETGTDGISPYTVVAGAVAAPDQWDSLETAWSRLLARSAVDAYHWKEFKDGKGCFKGWSDLKRNRFVRAQEKIIRKNTIFRISAGVHDETHKDVKERMRGIKGFHPDSNYGLCLRYIMFHTCDQLTEIDPDCQLTILVEDGPWTAGALATYQRVSRMRGGSKPSRYAHRLAGFGAASKGERFSLEAADYLAGSEHARLMAGKPPQRGSETLSVLFTASILESLYEGMINEKERRRAFARRPDSSSGGLEE